MLDGEIVYRRLNEGERFHSGLPLTGFENLSIDSNFCWVTTVDGTIVAAILAADVHGMAMLIRVVAAKNCPAFCVPRLIKHCLKDLFERGFHSFSVFLGRSKVERRLARICQRKKWMLIASMGVWVVGKTFEGKPKCQN